MSQNCDVGCAAETHPWLVRDKAPAGQTAATTGCRATRRLQPSPSPLLGLRRSQRKMTLDRFVCATRQDIVASGAETIQIKHTSSSSPWAATDTAIMWPRCRDETETPTLTENRLEAGPTTVEARLDKLMQENGHLRRQVDYFEGLLGNREIFDLSEALRAVVSEFNGRLESSNRQWKSDERR